MYNILVCDDEKDIVSALRIYLTAEGYRVYEAGNGREALEYLAKEDIHLVLMDIMMPEMDGITAMVKIREQSNVPVILLTAGGAAGKGEITAETVYAAWRWQCQKGSADYGRHRTG